MTGSILRILKDIQRQVVRSVEDDMGDRTFFNKPHQITVTTKGTGFLITGEDYRIVHSDGYIVFDEKTYVPFDSIGLISVSFDGA
jgi:hypothetical protein